jgi:hypothetical protein
MGWGASASGSKQMSDGYEEDHFREHPTVSGEKLAQQVTDRGEMPSPQWRGMTVRDALDERLKTLAAEMQALRDLRGNLPAIYLDSPANRFPRSYFQASVL